MLAALNGLARKIPNWAAYLMGAVPGSWMFYQALTGGLGPDPAKTLERGLGEWGLRFLIASLCVTPLLWAGVRLFKFRRVLGLLGFFYVLFHFTTWVVLDMGLRMDEILADLWKRPYIVIGFGAFLALLPLAITSTDKMIRRVGPVRWRQLHRLAYPAILAGAVHFALIGKVWTTESLIYLGIVGILLLARLYKRQARRMVPA